LLSDFPKITIKELQQVNIEGGYLIDGFPTISTTSAIATESLIHSQQFENIGIVDSDSFPPVSIIKNSWPNYPAQIFVNKDLKVAVFLSYLILHHSLHKNLAGIMLEWARQHKCSLIISSVAVKSQNTKDQIIAAVNTPEAKNKAKDAGLSILEHGVIPGIGGSLLNQGMLHNQNVVVLLFNSDEEGPNFKVSAELCLAMSKLVPGMSCDISSIQKEAEIAGQGIKETEKETKGILDTMYR